MKAIKILFGITFVLLICSCSQFTGNAKISVEGPSPPSGKSEPYVYVFEDICPPDKSAKKDVGDKPDVEIVPDSKAAIRIAEAVWLTLYGKAIYRKLPFKATLEKDVWTVIGTSEQQTSCVPFIVISKRNARVLKIGYIKQAALSK